jgi:hypothetical protein
MSKFKVVTPKGASFTVAGGGYAYEKEALDPIGAEIVEAPANEAEFIAAARTADAIYAKGLPIRWKTARSSPSAASASTASTSRPPPRAAFPSPTFPTLSSRKSPTTP